MKWTPGHNESLEHHYNNGYSDITLAKMFGTTPFAVAKQRSNLGLVKNKRRPHQRAPKQEAVKAPPPVFVLHYNRDGVDHYLKIVGDDLLKQGRQLMYGTNVKEVTVLKPVKKLVLQGVAEVEL